MSVENYLTAWGIYLLASVVMLWVVFYWSKKIPLASVRGLIRLLVACMLLTPYYTVPEDNLLSPLIMAIIMEVLAGNIEKAIAITKPAQFYFALMGSLWIVYRINYLLFFRRKRRLKRQAKKESDDIETTSQGSLIEK